MTKRPGSGRIRKEEIRKRRDVRKYATSRFHTRCVYAAPCYIICCICTVQEVAQGSLFRPGRLQILQDYKPFQTTGSPTFFTQLVASLHLEGSCFAHHRPETAGVGDQRRAEAVWVGQLQLAAGVIDGHISKDSLEPGKQFFLGLVPNYFSRKSKGGSGFGDEAPKNPLRVWGWGKVLVLDKKQLRYHMPTCTTLKRFKSIVDPKATGKPAKDYSKRAQNHLLSPGLVLTWSGTVAMTQPVLASMGRPLKCERRLVRRGRNVRGDPKSLQK